MSMQPLNILWRRPLVSPNPIDLNVVFKELMRLDETGNISVLLTIIFMFALYVLAIILARRADRKDHEKVTALC